MYHEEVIFEFKGDLPLLFLSVDTTDSAEGVDHDVEKDRVYFLIEVYEVLVYQHEHANRGFFESVMCF
jgi:hypothetical protein